MEQDGGIQRGEEDKSTRQYQILEDVELKLSRIDTELESTSRTFLENGPLHSHMSCGICEATSSGLKTRPGGFESTVLVQPVSW